MKLFKNRNISGIINYPVKSMMSHHISLMLYHFVEAGRGYFDFDAYQQMGEEKNGPQRSADSARFGLVIPKIIKIIKILNENL